MTNIRKTYKKIGISMRYAWCYKCEMSRKVKREIMEKYINISRPSVPPFNEYIEEIRDIWDTRMLTNIGEKHRNLERRLSKYLKVPEVSLFANGHLALEAALDALQLKGEVITTPFTFASTVQAILRNGLTPVFGDINETDYTLDVNLIERLITSKTCAILPVHIYGNICNVDRIDKIAAKHNLPVIYDAAHAFGITKDGVGIGNYGTVSMFSFHATKVFNTIEGGGLTYKDSSLKETFSQIRNFGMSGGDTKRVGTNAKMSELNAAMGLCNLRHIDEFIKRRGEIVEMYKEKLSENQGLILNKIQEGVEPNYSYFPIRIVPENFGESRDEVFNRLVQQNIHVRKYYYPLVTQFPIYKEIQPVDDLSTAVKISSQILTLPLYPDLQEDEINRICNCILEKHI